MRTAVANNNNIFAGLTRRTDQAKIAGVCAGIAAHFGWNLCILRIATIILCISVPPLGITLYLVLAVLLPQSGGSSAASRGASRDSEAPPPAPMARSTRVQATDAAQRIRDMEQRLRDIEAYMTSSRYEFDRQLRKQG